jgi:PH domain
VLVLMILLVHHRSFVCCSVLLLFSPQDESCALKGFLLKQGERGLVKLWKKRWFALHDEHKLYYFTASGTSRGYIDLRSVVKYVSWCACVFPPPPPPPPPHVCSPLPFYRALVCLAVRLLSWWHALS